MDDSLQRHVPMLLKHHPFMHHDSFVACDETVRLPCRAELLDRLCLREIEFPGTTARDLCGSLALAAAGSPLISSRDADLIAAAFRVDTNSTLGGSTKRPHDLNLRRSAAPCETTGLRILRGMAKWLTLTTGAANSRPPGLSNVVGPFQEDQVVAGLLRDSVVLCCARG